MGVIDVDVEVLEVLGSLGVLAASQVKDVGHSHFYQLLGFESRLIRTHNDTWIDLK